MARARTLAGAVVAVLVSASLCPLMPAAPAAAEGSRNFYPAAVSGRTCTTNSLNGSCRANVEWRTDRYGPTAGTQIYRRTLFSAYAQAGEVLLMGSSAIGVGIGDIIVYLPGVVTDRQGTPPAPVNGVNAYMCSAQRTASGVAAQGRLTTRAQELGGPSLPGGPADANHYLPCWFQAPATGIYDVAFYGPQGANTAQDASVAGDIALTNGNNVNANQRSSVAAFDLTVRSTAASTVDIPGRVFTYALAAFTGGNGRPVNLSFHVTTDDGYRYRTDTRGMDPNGFLLFANDVGFRTPEGGPLDHDVLGLTGGAAMSTVAGGVDFAPPKYPISFEPLAAETVAALGIPAVPTPPVVATATFSGSLTGNDTGYTDGGQFTVDGNVAGVYQIVISRDGVNFDPGLPTNRVLLATRPAGIQSVTWDGNDNTGTPWPAGLGFQFRASLRAGVYHFPLVDAENSSLGGPTFTLLNPPGGVCPFGRASCTTAFYDDRGYHTSAGNVGTPGTRLCGTDPPATSFSDPVTGYDSASGQRAFGGDTGGNANVSCNGSFGDVKGLDTWTYFPSNVISRTLNVYAAPVAVDDTVTTTAGTAVPFGVLGNDSGAGVTVTGHTSPAHGTLSGQFWYTPAAGYSGPDSFQYTITDAYGRTDTATVHITVTPLAVDDVQAGDAGSPVPIEVRDNDRGSGLTVTSVGSPVTGTVAIVDGRPVYTPPAGFSGLATFGYTVTDAHGKTASATVTVVVAVSGGRDDRATGTPRRPVTVDPLGNDIRNGRTFVRSSLRLVDPRTGAATTTVTFSGEGTYRVGANGMVTFTPVAGFTGQPTPVRYVVTDSAGQLRSATIRISYPRVSGLADTGADTALMLWLGSVAVVLATLLLVAARRNTRS